MFEIRKMVHDNAFKNFLTISFNRQRQMPVRLWFRSIMPIEIIIATHYILFRARYFIFPPLAIPGAIYAAKLLAFWIRHEFRGWGLHVSIFRHRWWFILPGRPLMRDDIDANSARYYFITRIYYCYFIYSFFRCISPRRMMRAVKHRHTHTIASI